MTDQEKLARAHTDVLDRIDLWTTSDPEIPLTEFLGWTDEEYVQFVENDELPAKELAN